MREGVIPQHSQIFREHKGFDSTDFCIDSPRHKSGIISHICKGIAADGQSAAHRCAEINARQMHLIHKGLSFDLRQMIVIAKINAFQIIRPEDVGVQHLVIRRQVQKMRLRIAPIVWSKVTHCKEITRDPLQKAAVFQFEILDSGMLESTCLQCFQICREYQGINSADFRIDSPRHKSGVVSSTCKGLGTDGQSFAHRCAKINACQMYLVYESLCADLRQMIVFAEINAFQTSSPENERRIIR